MITQSSHIQTVLDILHDEVRGDIASARMKMSPEYSQTWMYKRRDGVLFPSVAKPTEAQMAEAYHMPGREYHVYTITENENAVMVECVEQYTDEGVTYRTPLVLVVQFEGDDIVRGRHYCDPQLSYLGLSQGEIEKAVGQSAQLVIKG